MPGALGMLDGRVGVVTKGKRFDNTGKPTQVRLRWQDGSHSRWRLIQDVQVPPKPLSTIAQAMAAAEEDKRVAQQAKDAALHASALEEKRRQTKKGLVTEDGSHAPRNGDTGTGDAAAAFFETGVEADDSNDDDGDRSATVETVAAGRDGEGHGLLGIDIRKTDGEQTTDNSVWEPDQLLA